MICDFCSSPEPRWSYPAEDVNVLPELTPPAISKGAWLACDECAALIGRNEYGKLAERGLLGANAQMFVTLAGRDVALARVRRLHRHFRENRRGAPSAVESAPQGRQE